MRTALCALFFSLALSIHGSAGEPIVLYRLGEVPFELREGDRYGIMLVNRGGESAPRAEYILANRATRQVLRTEDFAAFKTELAKLPKGTKVARYDSCTVSRSWGLSEKELAAFETLLRQSGLSVDEDFRITCYCKE